MAITLNELLQIFYNDDSIASPKQFHDLIKKYVDNPELLGDTVNATVNDLVSTLEATGECILNTTKQALPKLEVVKSWNDSSSFSSWKNETMRQIMKNW